MQQNWPQIHPAAQWQAAAPAERTATTLLDGAARYECPLNGSRVVLTDEATLATLTAPVSRMRCPSCNEHHLLDIGSAALTPR